MLAAEASFPNLLPKQSLSAYEIIMTVDVLSEFARQLRIPRAELDPSCSFVALGGKSLTALKLVAACKQLGPCLLLVLGSDPLFLRCRGVDITAMSHESY